MMIIVQLILHCLLFTAMVRLAVKGGAVDGLYFYPKPVQERAIEIGLTTQEAVRRKRKRFMVLFYIVMLAALLLMIGLWNRVTDFLGASRNGGYSFCSDVEPSIEEALYSHGNLGCRGGSNCGVSCFGFLRCRWKGKENGRHER